MRTRMFEEIGKHLCSGPNDLDSVIDLDAFWRIRLFPCSLQRCMGNGLARLFQRFQEKMLKFYITLQHHYDFNAMTSLLNEMPFVENSLCTTSLFFKLTINCDERMSFFALGVSS